MNPKLRKWLEENGLARNATEDQAWDLYDKLKERGVELLGVDPGQRSAPAGGPDGSGAGGGDSQPADGGASQRSFSQSDIDKAADQAAARALIADAARRNDIQDLLDTAKLNDVDDGNFARGLLNDPKITLDQAREAILNKVMARTTPVGARGFALSVGVEAGEKFRAAALDGLCARAGVRVEKPADGASDFRGMSLKAILRESMELQGVNTRGIDPRQLVSRAAQLTSSDFPDLMSSLVGRVLLAAYQEWPSTFRPFVGVTSANDFKDIHAVKMSEAPDLQGLSEAGEYKYAAFSDAKETYRIITKGIKVALTREMIINDDLRAFTRIPQLFGSSAKRMEADAVFSLITSNPTMSDSKAVFHADHKNLGSAAAIGSAGLSAARAMMRKQVGLNGATIDVTPAFLVCPVEKETDAEVLLRSAALPEDNKSAGVYNPWAGKLTPIADPHLTGNAWYLFAHPNQFPAIEVAYLGGEEMPYIDEMVDFDSDALKIKVRHDFGAGWVDHVGAYKNPGA